MNRTIQPPIQEITNVELLAPLKEVLSNGIPIYMTHVPDLEVLKLEVVIWAGRPWEAKKLASKVTAKLLKEGTNSRNSKEISEWFDYYGASINIQVNLDYITISLNCLTRYFDKLFPVFNEIIQEPIFPENELEVFINNTIQKLYIDLSKSEVVAYRSITEKIFGENHPYGYNTTEELLKQITRTDLINHFNSNFISTRCYLFLSGDFSDSHLKTINTSFERIKPGSNEDLLSLPDPNASPYRTDIVMENSTQCALRLGRKLFTRNHPDYADCFILNTLLGGFFGSRLNMNIRETKGFTYSISSSLDTFTFDGSLIISSEMSAKHTNKAIKLIFEEFEDLKTELVSETELLQLKRYLMGSLIMAVDGPFNTNGVIKTLIADGVTLNLWDKVIKRIQEINSEDLMLMSQKYLNKEDFWIVTAGPKK